MRSRRRRVREPECIQTERFTSEKYELVTCYVNNLPIDITELEVERFFAKWGRVADVYIAKRTNKMGRFSGFVRFNGVDDKEWLEEQLKDIWFGSYKVRVNISKYARAERNVRKNVRDITKRKIERNYEPQMEHEIRNKNHNKRREGISYADAIRNKSRYYIRDGNSNMRQEDEASNR